jgi:hypothetical protein
VRCSGSGRYVAGDAVPRRSPAGWTASQKRTARRRGLVKMFYRKRVFCAARFGAWVIFYAFPPFPAHGLASQGGLNNFAAYARQLLCCVSETYRTAAPIPLAGLARLPVLGTELANAKRQRSRSLTSAPNPSTNRCFHEVLRFGMACRGGCCSESLHSRAAAVGF